LNQQNNPDTYTNPVIPGFHPDPSIIRVGDDYYMASSSFEFWPAIPIYHSKDLVNWQLINHVVTRTEQFDMSDARPSQGFYAPTLRHHKGTFYVAVTYVTRNPRRNRNLIFKTMQLLGEPHLISRGAMIDAVAVEAPHIYKKDGRYYLLVSEGGTDMGHAVTISGSEHIFGPYENYHFNPLLTHRHMRNTIEDFEAETLPLHWNTVRNTRKPYQSGEGSLVLQLVPETFKDEETPAFVGRRVQHHTFDVITKMHFTPENDNEEAGISLMVDDSSHYNFTRTKENDQHTLTISSGSTKDPLLIKKKIDNIDTEAPLYLRITSEMHRYTFSFSTNGVDFTEVANNISGRILSATGMVFTGTYVGMYASSKGKDSNNQAAYEWFVYRGF
jgi:beta-xylosidase